MPTSVEREYQPFRPAMLHSTHHHQADQLIKPFERINNCCTACIILLSHIQCQHPPPLQCPSLPTPPYIVTTQDSPSPLYLSILSLPSTPPPPPSPLYCYSPPLTCRLPPLTLPLLNLSSPFESLPKRDIPPQCRTQGLHIIGVLHTHRICLVPYYPHKEFGKVPEECLPDPNGVHPIILSSTTRRQTITVQ